MKKFIFSFFLFITGINSYSQSFMHGAGIGIFVANNPVMDASISGTLSYSPRFNFIETDALSVSVGVPINIGFSGSYSLQYSSYYGSEENNSLGFMINAPFMLNLNVGAGSSRETESRFGFFIGGGFGLHYGDVGKIVTDEYGYENYKTQYSSILGPAGNAGIRIAVGRQQKNIEIRLSYMKGIDDSKTSIYGINTLFNF
ncbi:MAG: hypothetical protein JWM28_2522 [Chitinophagaceae bacterium]|nr:hypothetical protein [Chitinophagaceae bacterium]